MENLFYIMRSNSPAQMTNTQDAYASLIKNSKAINILVSQAYQVDENGIVWGFVDPAVLSFAKKNNMKLMAMITNAGFDKDTTQKFLANPAAQKVAIQALVDACTQQHYYGIQFDFEMVPLENRDQLTQFYLTATRALHAKGFAVSYAVAPVVDNIPQTSDFQKRLYENWEGAYDLKALGASGDFVSIMAYNQHGEGTTPGPTASIAWVEATIKYALQFIPPQKISLGVASYSGYWYTGTNPASSARRISAHLDGISYKQVNYLLQRYQAKLQWDNANKNNYAVYQHDWVNEYIFVEDAKSFQAKLDLAKKYNLRGISVFDIGEEDPKIWDVLGNDNKNKVL